MRRSNCNGPAMEAGLNLRARSLQPSGKTRAVGVSMNPRARIAVRGAGSMGCMNGAPLDGRRILTTMTRRSGAGADLISRRLWQESRQVVVQNQSGRFLIHADFVERLDLRFEDSGMPAAWKIRRIGAEQQPARTCYVQRTAEDGAKIQMPLLVTH